VGRLLRAIPRYPGWILLVCALLTALAASQIVDLRTGQIRLRVDPSADRLLPEGDESRVFYDRVRRLFGSDETLLVALVTDDVFTTENLKRVERLTDRIQRLDGVHHVLSLVNAINVRGVDDDLAIGPFVTRIPEAPESLQTLRTEVLGNPIYGGNLVSDDSRATALIVYFREMSNQEYWDSGLDQRIAELADEESGDAEAWITGGPHIRAETARILLTEAASIPLTILAVLGLVLALAFRSVRGALLPLVTIAVAVTWTLGLAVALGYELNAVTALVPALLTTLGLSYSVHVVSEYDDVEGESGDEEADSAPRRREQVATAVAGVALPVGLTGLTTAAGFASLGLSPLGAVREFGALAVIGVACAAVTSLTVTPAALSLLPARRAGRAKRRRSTLLFERFAERVARFDVTHRRAIFVTSFAVFLLALLGAGQLRIGTQQVSKFKPDAPARVHFEAVNQYLEGANLFFVVLETDYPEGFKDPVNLREIQVLQEWLEEQPEIGGTTSLADYCSLLNRAFHGNDPAQLKVPETKRITSQLLFFGGSEELDRYVDSRYQTASIRVRANVVDSDAVAALATRIESRLSALPSHLRASLTGTSIVFTRTLDAVIRGQAYSVVAALGIIYLILSAMFVSLRIGFVALIPNVLPVVVFFGALGLTGIRLDPGMSLIAPMVVGIAVDDTIHYFARFIRDAKRMGDEGRATVSALRSVGRPVTYTSLALCVGFLVLNASELRSNAQLGSMAAFALAFAWLTDLTLTPALCVRLRIATLWDFLRMDLGQAPHHSIALFRGLKAGQARLVALMATMLEVPAGRRLFSSGEPGEALYVVIEGELRATVPRDDGTDELAVHTRGGVLGEVGLFNERRVFNVEVVEDARLLRLSQESIDQLGRQRPRIAAVVFRNLNELLARRLAMVAMRQVVHTGPPTARPGADRRSLAAKGRRLLDEFFKRGAGAYLSSLYRPTPGAVGTDWRREGSIPMDPQLVDRLAGMGIAADTITALTLIPLVEVAWADGRMDARERLAVLAGAEAVGIARDSASFELLRIWLETPPGPEVRLAWQEYIRAVCQELSVEGCLRLRAAIVGRARDVASTAGGFLGVGAVSRSEERVLEALEQAFE
jgi:hydrophobe/amphiphile efflux-3 (HAE3) family protein